MSGKSYYNVHESRFIRWTIASITRRTTFKPSQIGVITFYNEQVQCIKKMLGKKFECVEVKSVDGYQGREKDVIILSCVRAHGKKGRSIGFVASMQRMNVSITRAKHCLIVCGHAASLRIDKNWRALIEDATDRNLIVSVDRQEFSQRADNSLEYLYL
ncbi:hypothetical protein ACOME3_008865 [Neoechinorhynchus agilis]